MDKDERLEIARHELVTSFYRRHLIKSIGSSFENGELEDTYTVTGRGMLEIINKIESLEARTAELELELDECGRV